MKAAVVHELGAPLRIDDVAVPIPGAGQVLVRMEACGLCHTDIHAAHGDWPVKPSRRSARARRRRNRREGRRRRDQPHRWRPGRHGLARLGVRPCETARRAGRAAHSSRTAATRSTARTRNT